MESNKKLTSVLSYNVTDCNMGYLWVDTYLLYLLIYVLVLEE